MSGAGRGYHSRLQAAVLILSLLAREAGVLTAGVGADGAGGDRERLDVARRLLAEAPLIDGHNDLPWNIRKFVHNQLKEFNFAADLKAVAPWSKSPWSHTDLNRLRKGMVGGQFWVAYVPCESQNLNAVQLTLEQIDLIKRLIDKYQQHLQFASSTREIVAARNAHKIASLIGVEGGHSIGNSLAILRILYDLGVRYMTLTHTCNTPWAHSSSVEQRATFPAYGGLTNFGKVVVLEMNRLGMMVDLSHASVSTMKEALATSRAPVIFSHSSAFTLCNSSRNVPDDVLHRLAKNGGLVMVTFYNFFVKCGPAATVADVAAVGLVEICLQYVPRGWMGHARLARCGACTSGGRAVHVLTYHFLKPNSAHTPRTPSITHMSLQHGKHHINYIKNLIGVDHIGVGADFDGINRTPQGLEDVSMYPGLFAELLKSGHWSLHDLKKVAGLNMLRVFSVVEKIRDDMKLAGMAPSEEYFSDRIEEDNSKCYFDIDASDRLTAC